MTDLCFLAAIASKIEYLHGRAIQGTNKIGSLGPYTIWSKIHAPFRAVTIANGNCRGQTLRQNYHDMKLNFSGRPKSPCIQVSLEIYRIFRRLEYLELVVHVR